MSNLEARLASYKNWPTELEMKPEELAEAGFFQDPDDDDADQVKIARMLTVILFKTKVRCFHCGEAVWNWKHKHQSAWVLHARYRSICKLQYMLYL